MPSAWSRRYSVVLRAYRQGVWHPVKVFDNSHGERQHHEHSYLGEVKQDPIVTDGTPNEALGRALQKVKDNWRMDVDAWEEAR